MRSKPRPKLKTSGSVGSIRIGTGRVSIGSVQIVIPINRPVACTAFYATYRKYKRQTIFYEPKPKL